MTKNGNYESPRVFSKVELCLETSILQTSIVEFVGNVESTGQYVHDFEWNNSQPYFNHNWDEN